MAALWSASNKEGVCAHSRIQETVIIINQFILINQRQFKRNSEPNCFSFVEKIMHDAAQTMLSMDCRLSERPPPQQRAGAGLLLTFERGKFPAVCAVE